MSSKQSITENSSEPTCVWIFCQGDDEEDISMWEEASTHRSLRSLPENEVPDDIPPPPPETPPSASIRQNEIDQYVKASVSSALERARKRHSANLPLTPNSYLRKTTPPTPEQVERRIKVRKSMVSALSLRNMDL